MYSYKGYTYRPEHDNDGDCIKTYHDVYVMQRHGTEKCITMPLSCYNSRISFEVFKMWIDSGLPTKKDLGLGDYSASPGCVISYYNNIINNEIDKILLGIEE